MSRPSEITTATVRVIPIAGDPMNLRSGVTAARLMRIAAMVSNALTHHALTRRRGPIPSPAAATRRRLVPTLHLAVATRHRLVPTPKGAAAMAAEVTTVDRAAVTAAVTTAEEEEAIAVVVATVAVDLMVAATAVEAAPVATVVARTVAEAVLTKNCLKHRPVRNFRAGFSCFHQFFCFLSS